MNQKKEVMGGVIEVMGCGVVIGIIWSEWRDSNPRLHAPKARALPN